MLPNCTPQFDFIGKEHFTDKNKRFSPSIDSSNLGVITFSPTINSSLSSNLFDMQFYGNFGLEVRNETHNNLDMIKFCSDSLENPESTYTVPKNFLSASLCNCTELNKYYEAYSAEVIFQDVQKQNDNKRLHFPLLKQNDNKNLKIIDEKVEHFIKTCLCVEKEFSKHGSVLISLEGCSKQQIHLDYDDSAEVIDKTKTCFIVLIALNDNTKLDGIRYCINKKNESEINNLTRRYRYEIFLNKGDMFLARGIFPHGGSDYMEKNFRIHYYVNCNVYQRPVPMMQRTYLFTKKEIKHAQPYVIMITMQLGMKMRSTRIKK